MMLGLSSYSLDPAIASGEMTLYDAIDWAAAQGAECMELVPFSFTFMDDERHIDSEYKEGRAPCQGRGHKAV